MNKKNEDTINMKKALKILIVVFIILAIFYLISLFITNNNKVVRPKKNSADIQNKEILIGMTFNRTDKEYLVVFYNKNANNAIYDAVANYRIKDIHLPMYEVDMGNGMNSNYISNTSNKSATSLEELRVNGTTLIKFMNGRIAEYIEGDNEVIDYLK